MEELLGYSFDELNIQSALDEPIFGPPHLGRVERVDKYEMRSALADLFVDEATKEASDAAQTEFSAIVTGDGYSISREAFVAHREDQGTSTAEQANAVYDAITVYAGLESDSQVNVEQFKAYFVLVAEIVAKECLIDQSETYYGRFKSKEDVQRRIEYATAHLQVDIAKELSNIDSENGLTKEAFERAAKILVHDEKQALASHSFASLDFDSNGELDAYEWSRITKSLADQARSDPLSVIASELVSQFDTDGDYQIDREEFGKLATSTAALLPVNAADLEERFADLAGADGLISR